jgi:hypothetical protein
MILEVGICAFLAGTLGLCLVRGLWAQTQLRNQLRRQKAFTVLEAEVWITCGQKVQALSAPRHTSAGR